MPCSTLTNAIFRMVELESGRVRIGWLRIFGSDSNSRALIHPTLPGGRCRSTGSTAPPSGWMRCGGQTPRGEAGFSFLVVAHVAGRFFSSPNAPSPCSATGACPYSGSDPSRSVVFKRCLCLWCCRGLSIIPQDPVIFTGTLRESLPFVAARQLYFHCLRG